MSSTVEPPVPKQQCQLCIAAKSHSPSRSITNAQGGYKYSSCSMGAATQLEEPQPPFPTPDSLKATHLPQYA